MLVLEDVKTNLIPFDAAEAFEGIDLHHITCGPSFLIMWRPANPKLIAGPYSRLPYIQKLNDDGEPYKLSNRPQWLKQYLPVNPADLFMEAV